MITREQIEEALGEDKDSFKILKNTDTHMYALSLLRERIPYEKCKRIIQAAGHDQIWLCGVDEALEYLTEDDLKMLADCNMFIDSDTDILSLFA